MSDASAPETKLDRYDRFVRGGWTRVLKPLEQQVWHAFNSHANGEGIAYPGADQIAAYLGHSVETPVHIRRARKSLVELGLLVKTKTSRLASGALVSAFRVLVPPLTAEHAADYALAQSELASKREAPGAEKPDDSPGSKRTESVLLPVDQTNRIGSFDGDEQTNSVPLVSDQTNGIGSFASGERTELVLPAVSEQTNSVLLPPPNEPNPFFHSRVNELNRFTEEVKSIYINTPPTPSTENGNGEATRKRKRSPNAPPGFLAFWDAWPKHHRKDDKSRCLAKWVSGQLEARAAEIVNHVRACRLSAKWLDPQDYVPAPLVYLNKASYDAPPPPTKGRSHATNQQPPANAPTRRMS